MPIPSACRFRTLDGKVLALRELAGRPALINFWASWCTSCVEEMPALDRLHRSLAGRLGFLGVNLLGVEGETEETAREFERTTGVTYPSIFDERGLLFAHFSPARLMPSTVLVDKNGVIRYRSFGPRSFDELREAVERDLGIRS